MREREIFIGAAHYVKIALLSLLVISPKVSGQGMASGPPPPPTAKSVKCKDRAIPQLTDITEKSGIRFFHTSAPESRYIIESMSGGVLLLDYDRDGWLDISSPMLRRWRWRSKGKSPRERSITTITTARLPM